MEQVVIYCRVSTTGQAEEGWSLDAQEKACKKFADDRDYKIVKVFRDEGKSGTNTEKRPALQEMISLCQKTKNINSVLVYDTSRFARNTQDHLAVKAILKKEGTNLISITNPALDDSATGKMIDVILAGVNQFQSDMNSQKTKDGMLERFNNGWWPARAKLGYLNEEINGEKVITKDPIRWSLIQEALRMYLRGNYSAQAVSDTLYQKGLIARCGKKIAHSLITSMLKDSFYAGIMKWGGQEIMGKHEPMITIEEHKRILRIMDDHNQHASRRRIYDFLLRGYVFCDICGKRYTGEKRKKKNLDYYHCGASVKDHSNTGQNIQAKDLETMVEEKFKEIQFTQPFINLVIEKVKMFYETKTTDVDKQKLSLFNKKTGIEKNRETAENKLMAGTLNDDAFVRINEKFETEIKSIQKQVDELDKKRRIDIDTIRTILLMTGDIYITYKKAPDKVKRLYLSLFWEGFWVKDRQIIKSKPTQLIENLLAEEKVFIQPKTDFSESALGKTISLRTDADMISMASGSLIDPHQTTHKKEVVRIRTDWLRG